MPRLPFTGTITPNAAEPSCPPIVPAAELAERYEIARDRVVMSFSDEKRRQELKETDAAAGNEETGDYQRLLAVQEYLEKHSRIREDIALFVTTSKNKEGININDDDIRHVYIPYICKPLCSPWILPS